MSPTTRRPLALVATALLLLTGAGSAAAGPMDNFAGDPTDAAYWQEYMRAEGVPDAECAQVALPEAEEFTADQDYLVVGAYGEQGMGETMQLWFDLLAGESVQIDVDRTESAGMVLCTGTGTDEWWSGTDEGPTEDFVLSPDGDPRDPASWVPIFTEAGATDVSCWATDPPADSRLVADQNYLALAGVADSGQWAAEVMVTEGSEVMIYLDGLEGEPITTLIRCTGTVPDDWELQWPQPPDDGVTGPVVQTDRPAPDPLVGTTGLALLVGAGLALTGLGVRRLRSEG